MLSGWRERLEDVAARAGLGRLPLPLIAGLAAIGLAAAAWAFAGTAPAEGPEVAQVAEEPAEKAAGAVEATSPAEVVVHVVGAVRTPGVYRLPKGSRGQDAVTAAGGSLGNADLSRVNLARSVDDGEQLLIPVQGEEAPPTAAGGGPAGGGGAAAGGKVDINRASVQELDALPGVGPSTAEKIVREREANGPFATVEDLMRVPGIGAKKLETLKDLVTAG